MTVIAEYSTTLAGATWQTFGDLGDDWQVEGDEKGMPNWYSRVTVADRGDWRINFTTMTPKDGRRLRITEDGVVLSNHVITSVSRRSDADGGVLYDIEAASEDFRILTHDFPGPVYVFDPAHIASYGYSVMTDLFFERSLIDEPPFVNNFLGLPTTGTTDPNLERWWIETHDSLIDQLQDYGDIVGDYRFGSDGLGKIGYFPRRTSTSPVEVTVDPADVFSWQETRDLSQWANIVKLTYDWWDSVSDQPRTLTVRTAPPASGIRKQIATTRKGNPGGTVKALSAATEIRDRWQKQTTAWSLSMKPNRAIKPGMVAAIPPAINGTAVYFTGVVEQVFHSAYSTDVNVRPR